MEFNCWKKSYNSFGGSALFSPIACLLTVKLAASSYGDAIKEIDITANLRSATGKPRRTLERLFEQFNQFIETLPLVTFRRKRQKFEIQFLSEHFSDRDDTQSNVSVENLHLAAKEVATALSLVQKWIKKSDDFEVDRFLIEATQILATKIDTEEEWTQIRELANAIDQARLATKSPWELLEIDWDEFHPQAREILDDPFYWVCTDDFAPNGNDTGADLLEDFRKWNKKSPNAHPLKFLGGLMKRWGIEPIDWRSTNPGVVDELNRNDPIPLQVCNEAAIGLAFAVIKVRAECPPNVAEYGLAALERTRMLIQGSKLPDELKSEWTTAEEKMEKTMKSFQS